MRFKLANMSESYGLLALPKSESGLPLVMLGPRIKWMSSIDILTDSERMLSKDTYNIS